MKIVELHTITRNKIDCPIILPEGHPVHYDPVENVTVPEFIYQQFKKIDPNRPYLVDSYTNEKLTYGVFMSKVQSLARAFIDLNIKSTDIAMFLDDNSFSYTISYYAALFAGIPIWHLSPSNCAFEVAQRITNIPDKSVIFLFGTSRREIVRRIHEQFNDLVQDRIKFEVEIDSLNGELDESIYGEQVCELRITQLISKFADQTLEHLPYYRIDDIKEAISMIVCTSGTTGPPKGAIHSHYSMVNLINNISKRLPNGQGTKTLLLFATGHISGSMYLPIDFCLGNTVYLVKKTTVKDMMELIQRESINQALITPEKINEIVNSDYEKNYNLSSLKIAYTGGSILGQQLADKWALKFPDCPLFNLYGMTEFLCPIMAQIPDHANIFNHIGTVSQGTKLKIVSLTNGKALGLNQSGEIWIKGHGIFKGYYRNENATESAIDADGYYHSGDIGFIDNDLCVHVQDRIKEVIKVYSNSIFPTETEQFIQLKFDQVNEACVVGIPQESGNTLLRAYITLKEGAILTKDEVIDTIKENFVNYKHLKGGVFFIEKMPRTVVGKIDRQYFKRLIQRGL